jgi:hypothetical protein
VILLGSIVCACGDDATDSSSAASAPDVSAETAVGRSSARTRTPSELRDEIERLRRTNAALNQRIADLEGRQPDAPPAPRAADPADAAVGAREQEELRERLLAGVATPDEARRFWTRLRGGDAGNTSASSTDLRPALDDDGWSRAASAPVAEKLLAEDLELPLDAVDARWSGPKLITDGARGNAASFDGGSAHIDVGPCPYSSTAPFTLHAFVRTREEGFSTILIARDGEAVGGTLNVGRKPGHVSFEAWSWRTVRLISKHRIDDGAWHEIEVTYDPATQGAILSVDSVRQDAAVLGVGEARTAMLRLGDNIGAVYPYRGDIDDVRIVRRTAHPEAFGAGASTGR